MTICARLDKIASRGFKSLLIGVVDKQSTNVYYRDSDYGELIPYINNHGYWSSGEIGIDSAIGSKKEYVTLLSRASECGLSCTQDAVFGTLGYPAQIARFAASTLSEPTACLVVGQCEEDICSPSRFLHDLCIPEEDGLCDPVTVDHYAGVLAQAHLGAAFALPKPNLFMRPVLDGIMLRSLWQVRECGVHSFRIDMAKHIGILQLREIIARLRRAVEMSSGSIGNVTREFSVILEYWSTRYRDIQFSTSSLEDDGRNVYYYDFPLANALQQILMNGKSYIATINGLLAERKKWNIDVARLVPVFIDHDSIFRPIYNGSEESSAIVVAGFVMSVMLSANGPSMYIGYANCEAGTADLSRNHSRSEGRSGRVVSGIFDVSDRGSPECAIADVCRIIEAHGAIENWDYNEFSVEGDEEQLKISRGYYVNGTNVRRILSTRVSARGGATISHGERGTVIFKYIGAVSVVIHEYSADATQSVA
jgi:hypothetical protein